MRAARSFQSTWLPALAWACVIFAASGVPSLGTGLGTWDLVLRKLAHATEFGILAVLLLRALPPLPAWAVTVLYAVTDEAHQSLVPGRAGRAWDVLIDAAGAAIALLLWRRLRRAGPSA